MSRTEVDQDAPEIEAMRAEFERQLPGWYIGTFREHRAWAVGPDGEYPMLGDDGYPLEVQGWTVTAVNKYGKVLNGHAFDRVAPHIVDYFRRYEEVRR